MAKLIDNPDVRELVQAEVRKAVERDRRGIVKLLRDLVAERAGDAKTAGNRDAARYLTTLGLDFKARVAELAV